MVDLTNFPGKHPPQSPSFYIPAVFRTNLSVEHWTVAVLFRRVWIQSNIDFKVIVYRQNRYLWKSKTEKWYRTEFQRTFLIKYIYFYTTCLPFALNLHHVAVISHGKLSKVLQIFLIDKHNTYMSCNQR